MNKNAFTFIELTIVLVIVGIIIGAILGAQDMIQNSKNQTIIKEFSNFNANIGAFYLQYNALPGDMSNASSYWSGASNGDGDGRICCSNTESVYLWNHLARSSILEGNFDGNDTDILNSVPSSSTDLGYYKAHYAGLSSDQWLLGGTQIYEVKANFIGLGAPSTSGEYALGAVNASDAYAIDIKMDDGNASSGILVAIKGTNDLSTFQAGCVSSSTFGTAGAGTVSYQITNDTKSCRLIYWLQGAI